MTGKGRWGEGRREEGVCPGDPGPERFNCQDCLWEREIKADWRRAAEQERYLTLLGLGLWNSWLKPLQQPSQQIPPAGCRRDNPVAVLMSVTCWVLTAKSPKRAEGIHLTKLRIQSKYPCAAPVRGSIPCSALLRLPSSAKL